MAAYDPRTLRVSFGEPYELTYVRPSGEQDFDFEVLLDAPVDIETDAGDASPVAGYASSDVPDQPPAAIPEPTSLVLLLGGGLVLLISRKWRKNDRNRG